MNSKSSNKLLVLPASIVTRLNLNTNFPNVHTGFHEFDQLDDDLRGRKDKRMRKSAK